MKLAQYLDTHEITHADFANRIGVSQVSVTRYAGGDRIPRPVHMMAIVAATNGAVKPDDFFAPSFDQATSSHPAPRGHLSHKRKAGKRGG